MSTAPSPTAQPTASLTPRTSRWSPATAFATTLNAARVRNLERQQPRQHFTSTNHLLVKYLTVTRNVVLRITDVVLKGWGFNLTPDSCVCV